MSGLDITPGVPAGSQIIQAYGEGRFRIGGVVHSGAVFIEPARTRPWPVSDAAAITADTLKPLLADTTAIAILIVGCGQAFRPEPKGLRAELRALGVVLEWMDSGAACRTFNVLLGEGRDVAAAICAVD